MIKAILLDIEGTTTPIDFVHQTLFPYAKAKLGEFIEANLNSLKDEIAQLKTEYKNDFANQIYGRDFREDVPETMANYLEFLTEIDRKSTPLKSIQGKIWQKGYEAGELKSEIYEDVPRAFERWQREEKRIAIYSSGSVLAQKLIFKYSNFGDLSGFISNYFDTNIGAKQQGESYVKIAFAMNLPPKRLIFISDVAAELDAAKFAGFHTFLSIRKGNSAVEDMSKYEAIYNFNKI